MMQREKSAQRTHGSLEKGVRLLTAFLPDNKEIGVVELAKQFSMNRSTVSRMLTVLKRLGFVLQNPENKKYSLGPHVANLATAYRSSFQSTLTQLAKPYLDELRNEVNNTIILALPLDEDMVIAYVTEGFGPIKVAAQVGPMFWCVQYNYSHHTETPNTDAREGDLVTYLCAGVYNTTIVIIQKLPTLTHGKVTW